MRKSDVLDLLRDMPDELDIEKLIYMLYVRRKIELGRAAADAGQVITHEEFVRQSDEWRD
jgi:predicted transcriptional regulator